MRCISELAKTQDFLQYRVTRRKKNTKENAVKFEFQISNK